MQRRTLLATLGAGLAGGLAACSAPGPPVARDTLGPPPRRPADVVSQGSPATVCDSPPDPTALPAITDPAFDTDWAEVDVDARYRRPTGEPALGPGATVVGVEAAGTARAYPLTVLWWHEVVNDDVGGPVLVTYCPLCQSGMVADRLVAGRATRFAVSGQLWRPPDLFAAASEADGRSFGVTLGDPDARVRNSGNLLLVDEATGSYWSQLLAQAICGPRVDERLRIRPSTATTWGDWRRTHPDTTVLLPPPYSGTLSPGDWRAGTEP
jgi:hypothetical protein